MLPSNNVLITDEKGIIENIIDETEAGDNVQVLSGIISPGFINSHCHLELSHMKGLIPEGTGLVDFVSKIVALRHFAEEEILQAIKNGEDEMLSNGIVAVGDICNNTLTIHQKKEQRLAYYNFIEASGWNPAIAAMRFEKSKEINAQYSMLNAQCSINPHAPYSVSNELWNLLRENFFDKTISIHNQETVFEDDLFKTGTGDFLRMYELMKIDNSSFKPTGKTSLQSYLEKMQEAKNILLVHNTFIGEDDIAFTKSPIQNHQSAIFFCLCPNANQYIEKALPPIDLLREQNCNIVLGTDSLASNWSLSILDEIKTINKNFPLVPLEEMLKWATINGAKALQMDNKLGSFEKGKQPGIICLSNDLNNIKRLV